MAGLKRPCGGAIIKIERGVALEGDVPGADGGKSIVEQERQGGIVNGQRIARTGLGCIQAQRAGIDDNRPGMAVSADEIHRSRANLGERNATRR